MDYHDYLDRHAEYPVCNLCGKEIDLQEDPICDRCREKLPVSEDQGLTDEE